MLYLALIALLIAWPWLFEGKVGLSLTDRLIQHATPIDADGNIIKED